MAYELKDAESCKIECHDRFVDIQSTIEGAEGISVFDRSSLGVSEAYDPTNDVTFLSCDSEPLARVVNTPGHFAMLFPDDAHRPQEKCAGHPGKVRKLVIKVRVEAVA